MPRGVYDRKTAKPRTYSRSKASKSETRRSRVIPEMKIPDFVDVLGRPVYQDDAFEVRVSIVYGDLRVYAFHRSENLTSMPRGFVLGSNVLILEKGKSDES